MNIPDYQVSRLAKQAMDEGWLWKLSRGEYSLSPPPGARRGKPKEDENENE